VARHGELAAIERAVTNDPQVINASDELYKAALMTASADGQLDVVSLLLNKGYEGLHYSNVFILHFRQVAQLSQRDRAAGWVNYGQK